MNNIEKLLLLLAEHKLISLQQMMQSLNLGKRSIQDALRHARLVGKTNGFRIDNIKNKGYILVIENQQLFKEFQHELENIPSDIDTETRINLAILFLIQNSDPSYVTYDEIADYLAYPRSTVISDKSSIEKIIKKYECMVSSKSHYGIRLMGNEQCKRKIMFEIYATDSMILQAYERELLLLKEWVNKAFTTHAIYADEYLLHSVTLIIAIILIRKEHPINITTEPIRQSVNMAVSDIFANISSYFDVSINSCEYQYAAQIISKIISSKDVNHKHFETTKNSVTLALDYLDQKYHTSFSNQVELHHDLSYHTHALLKRKSTNYTISYPQNYRLSPHYTASLQLARSYIQALPQLAKLHLSDYDVYLISLFFRTAFENYKHEILSKPYKINYVSQSLMSFTKLNVQLLKSLFPNSDIDINGDADYDLLFYTENAILPMHLKTHQTYLISDMLQKDNLREIKRDVILHRSRMSATVTMAQIYRPLAKLVKDQDGNIIKQLKANQFIPLNANPHPLLTYQNIHLYTDILEHDTHSFISFKTDHKKEIYLYFYISLNHFYLYYDLDIVCDFIMHNLNLFLTADSKTIELYIQKTIKNRKGL